MSREAADAWLAWWRTLPPAEQARASQDRRWTLADWLYWLEPTQRQWYWWDAIVEDPDTLRLVVQVPGWPAPLGALQWLLRVAGASDLIEAE
jgi:hypothetical protein